MFAHRRKLILWIVAAVAIVVVWNWPSKWDRLEKWAKEKDIAYQRRTQLRQGLLQVREKYKVMSEKEEDIFLKSGWLRLRSPDAMDLEAEKIVDKIVPIPEVPAWVSELVKEQEAAKKK